MVKANDDLLGKGTGKELKKSIKRKYRKSISSIREERCKSNIFHVRTECKLLSRDSQESLRVR